MTFITYKYIDISPEQFFKLKAILISCNKQPKLRKLCEIKKTSVQIMNMFKYKHKQNYCIKEIFIFLVILI